MTRLRGDAQVVVEVMVRPFEWTVVPGIGLEVCHDGSSAALLLLDSDDVLDLAPGPRWQIRPEPAREVTVLPAAGRVSGRRLRAV